MVRTVLLALGCVVVALALFCMFGPEREAVTPSILASAGAQDDLGVGVDEVTIPINVDVSGIAQVITAVAGKKLSIVGGELASDTAGLCSFRSSSSGAWIGNLYFEANKPKPLTPEMLGRGIMTTTAGHAIYADGTGLLVGTLRVRRTR